MSQREKYQDVSLSVFSRIWTEYGEVPYLPVFSADVGKHGLEKL